MSTACNALVVVLVGGAVTLAFGMCPVGFLFFQWVWKPLMLQAGTPHLGDSWEDAQVGNLSPKTDSEPEKISVEGDNTILEVQNAICSILRPPEAWGIKKQVSGELSPPQGKNLAAPCFIRSMVAEGGFGPPSPEKSGTGEFDQKMLVPANKKSCGSPVSTEEWFLDPLGVGMGDYPCDGDARSNLGEAEIDQFEESSNSPVSICSESFFSVNAETPESIFEHTVRVAFGPSAAMLPGKREILSCEEECAHTRKGEKNTRLVTTDRGLTRDKKKRSYCLQCTWH